MASARLARLIFVVVLCVARIAAQNTGFPPFNSFQNAQFDSINLANLNVHFGVDIEHKAGRGTPFDYVLSYDSLIWTIVNNAWTPVTGWGWRGVTEANTGYVTYVTQWFHCPGGGNTARLINWTYHDPNGTPHGFPGQTDFCTIDGMHRTSFDGLYTIDITNVTDVNGVYTNSGETIVPPVGSPTGPGSITDRNGNTLSTTGSAFTDTLGVTALTVTGTNPVSYTYPGPGGNQAITVTYGSYTVKTNFGCGITEYPATPQSLVNTVHYPDGSQYTFTYEATPGFPSDVTGRIKTVTLRTGGQITYTYTGSNNGIICADGSTAGLNRVTTDGGGTWNYTRTGTPTASTTTVKDASTPQNQTVITFSNGYETSRQISQGASPVLETIYTCYNGTAPASCPGALVNLPISQVDNYFWMGLYNTSTSWKTTYNYNTQTGLLTDKYEYNLGSVGGGYPRVRHTNIQYAVIGNYISDRPSSVTTYDVTDSTIDAQTTYPSYDAQGNPLTITSWVSTGHTLSRTYTYNHPGGTVATATDVNGAPSQVTYTYGACNGAFPTLIQEPLSLSRTMSWDCNGGVVTDTYDENSPPAHTHYTYDLMWRTNSTTDPLSNVTNLNYLSATQAESVMTFNGIASAVDSLTTLDGMGRSKWVQVRQTPTSNLYDSVLTGYDTNGRVNAQSVPVQCQSGGTGCSTNNSSTTYDALNRPTQVVEASGRTTSYTYSGNDMLVAVGPAPTVQRQYEYDALGRLTSVCEITASGGGSCGQFSVKTGFWTKYTYNGLDKLTGVTQNAQTSPQETRSYLYDGLGRMTSESNPENATNTYQYETACGGWPASNGDLNKRTDGAGNVTCFLYDAFHRLTDAAGWANNNWRGPCRRFRYDTRTVDLQAMMNAKGRLAEASTDSCTGGAITDEGFSYDARGQLTDVYQSSPNSNGWYHLTSQYWANGAVNTISGLQPSVPTITYGVDGEGRTYSVTPSGQTAIVSSTLYNVASQPTDLTFGSADTDHYVYSPTSGLMTTYQYNVNNNLLSATLQWNANGTLQQLAISDPWNFNNGICNFSYDDLGRIGGSLSVLGVDCGSIWQQYFTYDVYGNITKTGSSAWTPGYDTHNHYTLGGVTYDGNGSLTYDTVHTYTWDPNWGNMSSIDATTTLTYDALGRMVEQNKNGTYTQIVYSPAGGKLALMNGQTLVKAFVPLPAGSQGVYTAPGLTYYRHGDWLGSSRFSSTPLRGCYYDLAYAPFGEDFAHTMQFPCAKDPVDLDFTGQNQDTASGFYDFLYREYAPTQGRWISPDPAGVDAVDPTDPQTWNRYAYVTNRPLSTIDPDGLMMCLDGFCVDDDFAAAWDAVASAAGLDSLADLGFTYADAQVTAAPMGSLDTTYIGIEDSLSNSDGFDFGSLGGTRGGGGDKASDSNSLNCTAYKATAAIDERTKAQKIEWGGFLYTQGSNNINISPPFGGNAGALPTFYQHQRTDVPGRATVVGWYHTHPLVPGYPNPEVFSGSDLGVSRFLKAPGFLLTPKAQFLRLDPKGKKGISTKITNPCH